jgi:hypothetical protein
VPPAADDAVALQLGDRILATESAASLAHRPLIQGGGRNRLLKCPFEEPAGWVTSISWVAAAGSVPQLAAMLGLTAARPPRVLGATFPELHHVCLTKPQNSRPRVPAVAPYSATPQQGAGRD